LFTKDIRTELYGPMGKWMDLNVPGFRGEFGVTAEARAAAKEMPFQGTFGKYYSRMGSKFQGPAYQSIFGGDVGHEAANLMTLYLPEATGKLSAEESIVKLGTERMFTAERIVPEVIEAAEGLPMHRNLVGALKRSKGLISQGRAGFVKTSAEGWIGTSSKGGSIFTGAGEEVISAQLFNNEQARILIKQTHRFKQGDPWKMHGDDVKELMHLVPEARMAEVAGDYAGLLSPSGIAGQTIEKIAIGERLQKTPYALMTQQIEAMSAFASYGLDQGIISADHAKADRKSVV
jgi:hypothetical protein